MLRCKVFSLCMLKYTHTHIYISISLRYINDGLHLIPKYAQIVVFRKQSLGKTVRFKEQILFSDK